MTDTLIQPQTPGLAATAANPEHRKIAAYPVFDWLRFILASIVVLVHAGFRFPGPIDGSLAVGVFLALSGWLIGGILLQTEWAELPRFFYNRATRIWCPYFATMILLYATAAAAHGIDTNWLKYLFYDATFTHITWTVFPRALGEMPLKGTGNHFWSISVEEQFYLFAPLLMLVWQWGKQLWTWVIVAALLLAVQSVFAPIALGVLAAVVNRDYGTNAAGVAWNATYRGPMIAAIAAVILFIAAAYFPVHQVRALLAVAVVLAAAVPGKRPPLGVFVGAISYPLYLNHWMGVYVVNAIAHRVGTPSVGILHALDYLAAIPIAIVAWFLIDRQVMTYRNGWYTRQRGQWLGATAYALLAIGLTGGFLIQRAGG
ncbi:acyltransferase family protein [Sphingomonas echinoides]|uniref:acyltransferase family protein n=1 Tax=Sphingomonas echinoides TaxID=59803 RepID=UPI0024130995|nr:acyltransferase [Sphingomonas echinoides]